MGYIEPENIFYGDIDERFTRRGGKKPQVIKIDEYNAIIRFILDEFRSLQDEGFILDVPILLNEENQEKRSSVWGYCRGNNFRTVPIYFIPVLRLVVSD